MFHVRPGILLKSHEVHRVVHSQDNCLLFELSFQRPLAQDCQPCAWKCLEHRGESLQKHVVALSDAGAGPRQPRAVPDRCRASRPRSPGGGPAQHPRDCRCAPACLREIERCLSHVLDHCVIKTDDSVRFASTAAGKASSTGAEGVGPGQEKRWVARLLEAVCFGRPDKNGRASINITLRYTRSTGWSGVLACLTSLTMPGSP